MTKALFYAWLGRFDRYIGRTPGRKVLFLLENCSTHGKKQNLPPPCRTSVWSFHLRISPARFTRWTTALLFSLGVASTVASFSAFLKTLARKEVHLQERQFNSLALDAGRMAQLCSKCNQRPFYSLSEASWQGPDGRNCRKCTKHSGL